MDNSEHHQRVPQGIWGAVLLPLNQQHEIDWPALADEIDILCSSPLDGIYTNGTAGEFHNQLEDEFEKLSELVANRATAANKPFQLGISHFNPRVTQQRLVYASGLSPTGVQFTMPDWWILSPIEQQAFIAGLQQNGADTPLILYNPPHAKQQLTLEQIGTLSAYAPSLVGAKLPGGDAAWYAGLENLPENFSVFVPGHTVAFGRRYGASGSYSNVACLSPAGACRHWQQIIDDPAAAIALEARIQKFMQEIILPLAHQQQLSNTALDKLLAAAGGWGPVSHKCMWPYQSADSTDVQRVAKQARERLPELF